MAFISQSGALCTAVLDWSLKENVGFSSFVSIGSMLDVNWGDLIDYFGNDPRTNSIVIYMESIGDARSFLSAAREVSLTKPIIVIKAGRTAAAAKAAASHTGSLDRQRRRAGSGFPAHRRTARRTPSATFSTCHGCAGQAAASQGQPALHHHQRRRSRRARHRCADLRRRRIGGAFAAKPSKAFNKILPSAWSHGNPVDILGDAEPERYAKALEIAAKDPGIDGMLIVLTPQGMTNPTQIAEQLRPFAKSLGKPVLASWMGGNDVQAGVEILNQAGIPTFTYPGHGDRRLQLHVEVLVQPQGHLRDSATGLGGRAVLTARKRSRSSPRCAIPAAPS